MTDAVAERRALKDRVLEAALLHARHTRPARCGCGLRCWPTGRRC